MNGAGIYADATAPKVSADELAVAQESWRSLLCSLFTHIKQRAVEVVRTYVLSNTKQ